jgi:aminomethyltransferase
MLYDNGGVVDDLIVYRRAADKWLVIVNASNIEKDFDWMRRHYGTTGLADVKLVDRSMEYALLAVQGPKAAAMLTPLVTGARLDLVGTYRFAEGKVAGVDAILARTGYTGEDGFELAVPWAKAPQVWDAVVKAGAKPAGLGARDTLRLEMKYALYGNDIDSTTNPLEAGLGWVVKLGKGVDFVGKTALERIKSEGVKRKLVGFEMTERGIARAGYPLLDPETKAVIGKTTSGTQSPSLDRPIGVGYVDSAFSAVGKKIAVEIRGEPRVAVVVQTPFYKR